MAYQINLSRTFISKFYLFSTVCLSFYMTLSCMAQSAPPAQALPNEVIITGLEKQTCADWGQKDVAALRRLLADDFVLIAGAKVFEREDAFQLVQADPPRTCSGLTPQVRVFGEVAWVTSVPVLATGSSTEQWQVVDVWTRRKDQWQLVFRSYARLDPIAYLEQAIDRMQENSLNRAQIDWAALRKDSLARAAGAEITVDTYAAIRFALASLRDHHSHLSLTTELELVEKNRPRSRASSSERAGGSQADKPTSYSPYVGRYEPEGHLHHFHDKVFARVVVPKGPFQAGPEFVRFETQLQHIIAELDAAHPVGWIVDLRGNVGGNMWPMLAGVGPLLGDSDHLGEFSSVQGHSFWFYRNGVAGTREGEQVDAYPGVEGKPYKIASPPPVAVLIDRSTGSSGEAVAIAFRGRPMTRFFGEHTQGVSTVNGPFQMIDGATIWITVGVQADRTGKQYVDGLAPDEEIPIGDKATSEDQDKVLQSAMVWLENSSHS